MAFLIPSFWQLLPILIAAAVMLFVWKVIRLFRPKKAAETDVNINIGGQTEKEAGAGTLINPSSQMRFLSVWEWLKKLIAGYIVAAAVLAVAFLVGGDLVLIAVAAMIPSVWWYTKKVYRPTGVPVIVAGDSQNGQLLFTTYIVPYAQFENVNVTGISNYIQTPYGLGFHAESMQFLDDGHRVVGKIDFAWLHYNELNFRTKHRIFHEMRPTMANLIEENNRYHWLMDSMSNMKAREMTRTRLDTIFHAKRSPSSAVTDQEQLYSEISKLKEENAKMRIGSGSETERGTEAAGEEL